LRVATRTTSGLYDGASPREPDELSIRTAALLTAEEPEYSRLAARLLAGVIAKEVAGQEIHAFSQSIARGHEVGLINDRLLGFVQASARKLNDAVDTTLDRPFDYFGDRQHDGQGKRVSVRIDYVGRRSNKKKTKYEK